ncbi:MAG: hypothetical protein JSS09_10045 [Verrucomicrobia bacterium]|nr:hypothetical protein [Verrucomicrobiota bacterium]
MVNSVSGASINPVTVVDLESKLSSTDQKTVEVKAKGFQLKRSTENIEARCDALRRKLAEFGVRPNCAMPPRFEKQSYFSRLERSLKKQLATAEAEFDKKVTDATVEVKELQDLDKKLADKITELESRLKAEGKNPKVVVPKRMGVVVSNEKAPLGLLKTQGFALGEEIRYKKAVIEALEKKLS